MTTATLSGSVYRLPGRAPDSARVPAPSPRTLLRPLATAVAFATACIAPPALFQVGFVPGLVRGGDRLVPSIDVAEDVLAVLACASFVLLLHGVARRVKGQWAGMPPVHRALYVAALLLANTFVLALEEGAFLASRGGIRLFEPRLVSSARGPSGSRAYLYEGGLFSCSYELYVSSGMSLTTHAVQGVRRNRCSIPPPQVRWDSEGSPRLFDAEGAPLSNEEGGGLQLFWGGGC
jgi:hypothetical protein